MTDHSRHLEGLVEIASALTSTKTCEDILSVLVRVIADVVDVVRCSVILIGQHQGVGQVVATFENASLKALTVDLEKYPEITEALKTGQVVLIEDVHHDVRMKGVVASLKHLDVCSILVIPITYREQILGTLFLRTSRPQRAFTPSELLFCQAGAKMAANALLGLADHQRLVEHNEELANQAAQDTLTGLLNHGSLLTRLDQAYSLAERYGRPLSYLMVDLDHFKHINDTFGHQEGDHALQRVAQAIHQAIRKSDVAARYGGDEFAIVLPETDAYGALVEAERIRRAVGHIRLSHQHPLSVSIGVATMPSPVTSSKEDLMRQADQALYLAKTAGRNRTVSYATTVSQTATLD